MDKEKQVRAKMILDGSNLLFFFKCRKDLYGAPETSRVVFAKLKDKDDEDNYPGWRKEANFTATNLFKLVDGEENQTIFGEKDMPDIEVVSDKDKIEKELMKHIS